MKDYFGNTVEINNKVIAYSMQHMCYVVMKIQNITDDKAQLSSLTDSKVQLQASSEQIIKL